MEDREGETALHKAAMAGKLPTLSFLISAGASADSTDADGWTPLHNACSKGFLDIVKVLIENANASLDVKGGRGNWTPLMNAASNGHLPIVRYMISKQSVDPFVRNSAGETAYDVAAANFEIFICEILERYESERWAAIQFTSASSSQADTSASITGPYNPLALHVCVPIVLHENQRLDTRLSTLAIRGGKSRWSGTQAGRPDKHDKRAPGTMPPGPLSSSRTRNIPIARDDVRVPSRTHPYKLRLPNRSAQMAAAKRARGDVSVEDEQLGTTPTPDSVLQQQQRRQQRGRNDSAEGEPAHFWLSEWQLDLTHPQVDAEEGWQYSQSFDTPDEKWSASVPAPVVRLLDGRGLGASVQRAVSNVMLTGAGSAQVSEAEAEAVALGWVRRRRWVRVMRRRLDIEFGDELEASEQITMPSVKDNARISSQAQAEAERDADALGASADYVARSKAMAGSHASDDAVSGLSKDILQYCITRLELAIAEIRQNAFSDSDNERQQTAEGQLKDYTLYLGQLRQAAGLDEESDDEEVDSDDEFIYPNSYKDGAQSVITRIGGPLTTPAGVVPGARPATTQRQSSTLSVFGERAANNTSSSSSLIDSSVGATRIVDLANARDFRVPTHEVPQRVHNTSTLTATMREFISLPEWEDDAAVTSCRGCQRKFTFFLRKHHCRRCGRIYCDACSSHRAKLQADELVIDPGVPEMLTMESLGASRVCDSCDAERRMPAGLRGGSHGRASHHNHHHNQDSSSIMSSSRVTAAATSVDIDDSVSDVSDVSSRASELTECPVCNKSLLAAFGEDASAQEEHVRACLETNGGGGALQSGRYLVYKLQEGPIVGRECQICLEDLLVGMTVARLPCLCFYHRHCIDAWFKRGRACPVHARVW